MSYQLLHINVTDVNDNPPVFDRHIYVANVTENSPVNTKVTTIHANDADTGVNGELIYSIPSGIAEDKFVVEKSTGVVSVRYRLDREERSSYTVTGKYSCAGTDFVLSYTRVALK